MENPESESTSPSEESSALNRNRSFKSKQLVRSQAIRESQSPPRPASPAVDDAGTDTVTGTGNGGTGNTGTGNPVTDVVEVEEKRRPVEIHITGGAWESGDQKSRRRWPQQSRDLLSNGPRVACVAGCRSQCSAGTIREGVRRNSEYTGGGRQKQSWESGEQKSRRRWPQQSRDLLSNGPRVACVAGCRSQCRGQRRRNPCPTKQDSGISCPDDCTDCSDYEHTGGSSIDIRKACSLDSDESYCRCPEGKVKPPKTNSLSRTDSADNKMEPTGPELVNFIRETLNKNTRDRMLLLKIEKELHALVTDTGRCNFKFPCMTSYERMLVHRVATLFQLTHHLDQNSKNSVTVSKSGTSGGRIPCTSFKQWCTVNFPPSPVRQDSVHANTQEALNQSGPEGLIFLQDDLPLDIQNEELISSPAPPPTQPVSVAMTPGHESPILPVPKPADPEPSVKSSAQQPDPAPTNPDHLTETRRSRPRRGVVSAQSRTCATKKDDCLPTAPAVSSPGISSAPLPPLPAVTDPVPQSPCASGLRAAGPRVVSLHVYNLSEETTTEDVVRHVQTNMGIAAPVCQKLVVTRGNYTSFRLDVPADKVKAAKNVANWPSGVGVRYFNVVQPKNSNAQRATTTKR
ncbi:uncharacterized protein LOC134659066 [Cydia amplana]|uniref:uncharacterized protein LOC134659066 n=1 Tax=Cydia amplana TaxID=1869771 RepID=UPI002FE61CBD